MVVPVVDSLVDYCVIMNAIARLEEDVEYIDTEDCDEVFVRESNVVYPEFKDQEDYWYGVVIVLNIFQYVII